MLIGRYFMFPETRAALIRESQKRREDRLHQRQRAPSGEWIRTEAERRAAATEQEADLLRTRPSILGDVG
jgi:hypothetical protein